MSTYLGSLSLNPGLSIVIHVYNDVKLNKLVATIV